MLGLEIGSPSPCGGPEPSRGARGPTSKTNGMAPLVIIYYYIADLKYLYYKTASKKVCENLLEALHDAREVMSIIKCLINVVVRKRYSLVSTA